MMRGAGEEVGPGLHLPRLFAVLVNPRVPVETPAVFKALGLQPGDELSAAAHPAPESSSPDALFALLKQTRNDLEPAALRIQPLIGEALGLIRETGGCRLARMSGSGATVFGLYDDCEAAAKAGQQIRRLRPDWWVKATSLR
jgi:4-diphosphocytidyl-2-C-methyl-D-erythritol kinase